MRWSEPQVAGFLLAATLASDRAGREALPGLARSARPALQAAVEALDALDSVQRRRRVAMLAARFRLPTHGGAARGAAPGPGTRAGFVAEPGLVQLLRRIAASPGAG
jgi:hypothetical protein